MRKRYLILFTIVLGLIVTLATARGSYRSEKDGEEGGAVSPGSAVTRGPGRPVLSMDIKDEPLKDVLKRLSDQNGITFSLPPSLGEEKVMIRFSNLTLEECLVKLLEPYNRIFIYKEDRSVPEFPVRRLTEVRIFPHEYEGRVKEPVMKIAEGAAEVKGEAREKESRKDTKSSTAPSAKRETTYIDDLTTTLKGRDRQAKLDAVEVLRDAAPVHALGALSVGIRDRDPLVKKEAVDALLKIGEEIKAAADPVETGLPTGDDDDADEGDGGGRNTSNNQDPDPVPEPSLSVASNSGNSASLTLENAAEVKGLQFRVVGAQVTGVRTTARTEGFFATFNEKQGTVILLNPSGGTIAPGTGPVAEIDHSGGTVNISGKKYATK